MRPRCSGSIFGLAIGALFLACGGDDGSATDETTPDASGGNVAADGGATGETAADNRTDASSEASAADAEAGAATVAITLSTDGDGAGTVEVDPPGGVYEIGTKITLSATATTGAFVGWSGAACDPLAEGVLYEEVCHVTVTSSALPSAVFGGRTLTGSVDLTMSRFSETDRIGGKPVTCAYDGADDTTTVTVDLAVLKDGTAMGKARSESSILYVARDSPLVCDAVLTVDAASLPAALSVNGANVLATTSTSPSETTTTLTGVLAGSGTDATITGNVAVSFQRIDANAPSTGTGRIVLSVAPR